MAWGKNLSIAIKNVTERKKAKEIYYAASFHAQDLKFHFSCASITPPKHVLYNNKLLIFSLKSEILRNKPLAYYRLRASVEAIFYSENPLRQKEWQNPSICCARFFSLAAFDSFSFSFSPSSSGRFECMQIASEKILMRFICFFFISALLFWFRRPSENRFIYFVFFFLFATTEFGYLFVLHESSWSNKC